MVIELNGLPGSGKSYLAKELESSIKDCSLYAAGKEKRLRYKLLQKVGMFFCWMAIPKESIKDLLRKYKNRKGKYTGRKNFKQYLTLFLYQNLLYSQMTRKKKIYIFDEGIYQVLVSMASDFDLTDSEIEILAAFAERYNNNRISVFYHAPIDVCLESIIRRSRKDCPIDFLSKGRIEEMLADYDHIFRSLYQSKYEIDRLDLCRLNEIEENIKTIQMQSIKGRI